MVSDTRITATVPFSAVQWHKVIDVLVVKFKLPFIAADGALHDLFRRYFRILNLEWFRKKTLSPVDNSVATAICEVHSADTVILTHNKRIHLGPLSLGYGLELELTPRLSRHERRPEGDMRARIHLAGFGGAVELTTARQVVAAQIAVLLAAVVSYVVLCFVLLYGVSVLWSFHQAPAETLIAGTNRLHIGVALLAVFVGFAGLFGRAVANVVELALARLRLRAAPAR